MTPTASRTDPADFERRYRSERDPWGYEQRAYEQAKYARTLDAIGPGPFGRALELGCSIGVFTALLAPRCRELVAVDGAPTALAHARARLDRDGARDVRLVLGTLPEALPAGPFDLIVASELLYYWSAELLTEALPRIEAALAPGGLLVAVHWRGPLDDGPLDGDRVHALLRTATSLDHADGRLTPDYRLDRFTRPRPSGQDG